MKKKYIQDVFAMGVDDWNKWATDALNKYSKIEFEFHSRHNDITESDFRGMIIPGELFLDSASFHGPVDFSNCKFHGPVHLNNATFVDGLNLQNSKFDDTLDLTRARFTGNLNFTSAIFEKQLNMSNCNLDGTSNFSFCDFRGHFLCENSNISGDIDFRNSKFLEGFRLSGSTMRSILFKEVNITGNVKWPRDFSDKYIDFSGAEFSSPVSFPALNTSANFKGAKFLSTVNFDSLGGDTDLSEVNFLGPLRFVNKSNGKIVLLKSTFSDVIKVSDGSNQSMDFSQSNFRGKVIFTGEFSEPLIFDGSEFLDFSSFKGVIFKSPPSFFNVKFKDFVTYENATLPGESKFLRTIFEVAPNFHGCTFLGAPIFSYGDAFFEQFPDLGSDGSYIKYQALKSAMDSIKATYEERNFFSLEIMARARAGNRSDKMLSSIYQNISGFGVSLKKPFLALLGAWIVFSAIYAVIIFTSNDLPYCNTVNISLWFLLMLKNTIPILYPFTPAPDKFLLCILGKDGAYIALVLLGALHAAISLILLFFIGLALRNRFRLQ